MTVFNALEILLLFVGVVAEFGGNSLYLLTQVIFLLSRFHLFAHSVGNTLFHSGKVQFRKHVHAKLFHSFVKIRFLQNLLARTKFGYHFVCDKVCEKQIIDILHFGKFAYAQLVYAAVYFRILSCYVACFFEKSLCLVALFTMKIQRVDVNENNTRGKAERGNFRRFQCSHGNYYRLFVVLFHCKHFGNYANVVHVPQFLRAGLRCVHLAYHKEYSTVFQRKFDGIA